MDNGVPGCNLGAQAHTVRGGDIMSRRCGLVAVARVAMLNRTFREPAPFPAPSHDQVEMQCFVAIPLDVVSGAPRIRYILGQAIDRRETARACSAGCHRSAHA